MIDIAEKLFPNLLTIITQLAATGIIYLLYRRYVHQHVLNFLDKQAEEIDRAQHYAEEVEEEAAQKSQRLDAEHQKRLEQLNKSQQALLKQAQLERESILKQAEAEKESVLADARVQIEKEKQIMLREVEEHVLDLAVSIAERTLENYSYDEDEVFEVLEYELEQMHHEAH
jgi:F-type H+-transporting ATPase subunit b